MKLSVVIPAHNEEDCIEPTLNRLYERLHSEKIDHELLVINDNSHDRTVDMLRALQSSIPTLRYVDNAPPNGFGLAVRKGLESAQGDAIAVFMADSSDDPVDLVRYYRVMVDQQVDCVFGSRFLPESKVINYPKFKLAINRMANTFIRLLFGLKYNDVTNAFKLYRKTVVQGLKPFLSHHFNLTVELPLKSIIRGYSYAVVPCNWTDRTEGVSKLKIEEMGSRYLFIVLYCLLEKWLSRGDYRAKNTSESSVKSERSKQAHHS